jgi:hypothetical protein
MRSIIYSFIVIAVLISSYDVYPQGPPPPPVFLGVADSCTSHPKLLWSRVPTAQTYCLRLSVSSIIILDTSGIADTFFTVQGGLWHAAMYALQLRSTNSYGSGSWSAVYQFVLHAGAPPPPVFLGLADSGTSHPTLLWSRVPTALTYRLQISINAEFTQIVVNAGGLTDTFFTVQNLTNGHTYYFHLNSTNLCGTGVWSPVYTFWLYGEGGIEKISNEIPAKFGLSQNYPNPFNPKTLISFDVPSVETIHELSLRIYDILGREIATLVNEQLKPGSYRVDWDGTNYPCGVYFYKLQAGDYSSVKKMVLLK